MSNGTDRPARAALPKSALGSPQDRPKASRARPFPFPIDPTPLTPQRSAERRFGGLSTDCCDSGELSTLKHPYSFPVKHPYSALKSPVKHPYTQVVKDQVVQEQVVGATTTVDKSPGSKPGKDNHKQRETVSQRSGFATLRLRNEVRCVDSPPALSHRMMRP